MSSFMSCRSMLVNVCLLLVFGSSLSSAQVPIQMVDVPDTMGIFGNYDMVQSGENLEDCKAKCLSDVYCMVTEFRDGWQCISSSEIVDTEVQSGSTVSFKEVVEKCPNSTDTFPDRDSCQHYRMCVFDMLFRVECDSDLSYDSDKKKCVQIATTAGRVFCQPLQIFYQPPFYF